MLEDRLEEVNKNAFKALSEYARDRMCLISGSTGNLLRVGPRLFIVTCYHVAKDFIGSDIYRYVTLRSNDRIRKEHMQLVAYRNECIDIAIIEIHAKLNGHPTYKFSDLDAMNEFTKKALVETNVIVCGNPTALARDEPRAVFYEPMTFMTIPDETRLPSSDFLYCKYPMQSSVVNVQTDNKMPLPAARGLSGSFMLKITPFEGPIEQVWTPEVKVIAVQQSWDERTYIKGTNIKHAIDLFRDLQLV